MKSKKCDIKITSHLYWSQTAKVRVDNYFTQDIEIQRRLPSCILPPLLINIYSEVIFQEVFSDYLEGASFNG